MSKKIILLLIVFLFIFILGYSILQASADGIALMKLNNMKNDISILEDRVILYYLNNDNLPVKEGTLTFNNSINPNDGEEYFEIDLEKIENLNINYGYKEYGENDRYIINKDSFTIYYEKGIEYKNTTYYTNEVKYQKINLEEYQ